MQSPNFNYIANDNQVTRHNMQQVVGLNVDFHAGCKKFTSFDLIVGSPFNCNCLNIALLPYTWFQVAYWKCLLYDSWFIKVSDTKVLRKWLNIYLFVYEKPHNSFLSHVGWGDVEKMLNTPLNELYLGILVTPYVILCKVWLIK